MTDDEWLLEELRRWSEPDHDPGGQAQVRAALESPEHQVLAARLRNALASAHAEPMDWPLPAPC